MTAFSELPVDLQAVLATSSALTVGLDADELHHPVTCGGPLSLDDDGTFSCDHTTVGPEDARTRFCLTYSVSLLLIELSGDL